jgi:hypothetical protein
MGGNFASAQQRDPSPVASAAVTAAVPTVAFEAVTFPRPPNPPPHRGIRPHAAADHYADAAYPDLDVEAAAAENDTDDAAAAAATAATASAEVQDYGGGERKESTDASVS